MRKADQGYIHNHQFGTIVVDFDILNKADRGGSWNQRFRVDHELDEMTDDDSIDISTEAVSTNGSGIDERHSCAQGACDGARIILVIVLNCEFTIVLVPKRLISLFHMGRPRP